MICELCGKETDKGRTVYVEGSRLSVCPECARFGDSEGPAKGETAAKPEIAQRLEKRERRMRTKDVYRDEEPMELAEDYPQRVKSARVQKNWKQEDLAAKINEKKSVIHKIEGGDMRPNDSLVAKLEKELDIRLMEKVPMVQSETKKQSSKGMTLGDLIKIKKE
ncbi:MAG: multiprotein bridging factor aMBF1 [Methanomassiliicoccales archaeon]